MAAAPREAPGWAVGAISELLAYEQQHAASPAESERLIEQLESAVPVWRSDRVRYAEHYGFYADFLYMRHEADGDGPKLDRAMVLWREASAAPGVSGLVASRLRLMGIQLDVAAARRDGGPTAMAERLSAGCAALRSEMKDFTAPTLLGDVANNAVRWAHGAAGDGQWSATADAYELAARAVDQLFRSVKVAERLRVVAAFRTVPADAASALLRAGRPHDAVVVLEVARQCLTRFSRGLTDLDRVVKQGEPDLYAQFMSDLGAWADTTNAWLRENDPARIRAARDRSSALEERAVASLTRVRQLPGLERYMMRPGFGEIRLATDPFPLLYVWTSHYDTSFALVLPDGTVPSTCIDGLTSDHLGKVLEDWIQVLQPGAPTDSRQREQALALVGAFLEPIVAQAMKDLLTQRFHVTPPVDGWRWGPVTLIVSGLLSFVPVHAWSPMLTEDATGKILAHMPLLSAPSARQALSARCTPRPTPATRRILSLADPAPRLHALAALPYARLESTLISETAAAALVLHGEQATPQAFLASAADYPVLHLACHGSRGTDGPGSAYLELGGGLLTANQILSDLTLDGAAVVVVSACRSGEQDSIMPEESLDLGSMFLAAGARAVVANMWPVDDLGAALFVWQMFRYWDWGDGLPLYAAVHATRLWLKELTVQDLIEIARHEPRWQAAIGRYTRFLPPQRKRFWEPYYWAAFAYAGGG